MSAIDTLLWFMIRISALAAFAVLAAAVTTGVGIRTGLFEKISSRFQVKEFHRFLTWFWLPLIAIHIVTIVLDSQARIGWVDTLMPFGVGYGRLAIGLGTLGFDLLIFVTLFAYLSRGMGRRAWLFIHRLSYAAFAMFFFHAVLAGSDLASPIAKSIAWGSAATVAVLSLSRLVIKNGAGDSRPSLPPPDPQWPEGAHPAPMAWQGQVRAPYSPSPPAHQGSTP